MATLAQYSAALSEGPAPARPRPGRPSAGTRAAGYAIYVSIALLVLVAAMQS